MNDLVSACLISVALLAPASCWAQGHANPILEGGGAGTGNGYGLARCAYLGTSAASSGSAPSISAGGIVSAGAYGAFTSIAPGSWIEIYGSNLAVDSRSWAGGDFNGVNAPTSLDGTSVTIGGQAAFIDYISAGQVNVQVPSNVGTGTQQVVVKTANGSSTAANVTVKASQPGLLAPSSFNLGGTQYAVALFSDGVTYVLPPGAIPGLSSRRAQPGDTITFYGVGFGAVIPNISAGQIVQQDNALASQFQIKFGTTQAAVTYDGLAPSAVGSYQFNVVVPSIPSSDAVPVTFTLGGVAGTQTSYVAVQNGSAAPTLQGLTLSAASVAGGGTVQGTVQLSAMAPTGGAVVALSSSNSSAASVPATVTVPSGSTSATFTITAGSVSGATSATITASYGGGSAQAMLSVAATGGGTAPQFSLLTATTTCPGGNIGTASIGLNERMPNGSIGPLGSLSCVMTLAGTSYFEFGVEFSGVSINGNTFSLSNVVTGPDTMMLLLQDGSTSLTEYPITSGSATVTLNSQTSINGVLSGTLTANFTVTSSYGTVSATSSGTFTAQ